MSGKLPFNVNLTDNFVVVRCFLFCPFELAPYSLLAFYRTAQSWHTLRRVLSRSLQMALTTTRPSLQAKSLHHLVFARTPSSTPLQMTFKVPSNAVPLSQTPT